MAAFQFIVPALRSAAPRSSSIFVSARGLASGLDRKRELSEIIASVKASSEKPKGGSEKLTLEQLAADSKTPFPAVTASAEFWQKHGYSPAAVAKMSELKQTLRDIEAKGQNQALVSTFYKQLTEFNNLVQQKKPAKTYVEPANIPKVAPERLAELEQDFEKNRVVHAAWFYSLTPAQREQRLPKDVLAACKEEFLEVAEDDKADQLGFSKLEDIDNPVGVPIPSLQSKQPLDAADAWICRAAQLALFTRYQNLRADIDTLKTRQSGDVLNIDTFLLPLPQDIKPNAELAQFVKTQQTDAEEEARRQIQITGGHLNKRFSGLKSWEDLKNKLKEGYSLEQAAILHYYTRFGAPSPNPAQRRVTLFDIYVRKVHPQVGFDPVYWDLLNYEDSVEDPDFLAEIEKPIDFPKVIKDTDHPSVIGFQRAKRLQYLQWYIDETDAIHERVRAARASLPSSAELEALPDGVEKTLLKKEKSIHRGLFYSSMLHEADRLITFVKAQPSWYKDWFAKANKVLFSDSDKSAPTLQADPEAHEELQRALNRLQTREELDK